MDDSLGLGIVMKKGDPKKLSGRLIAYATVSDSGDNAHKAMVRNGLLAVQANYVDQRNIKDFFQAEFGVSLEKGIQEIIEQAKESGGLEGALDPEVVREKLESMRNMEFIPIPAKVTFFESEAEILGRPEDVYYLGHFEIVSHAHLCVNSFPILYQAKFREQEHRSVAEEIEAMLGNLEKPSPSAPEESRDIGDINSFKGDIKTYLLKEILPGMIYNREDVNEFRSSEKKFKTFMKDFGFPQDTQAILSLARSNLSDELSMLELLVEKIVALQQEDYIKLEEIKSKIEMLK